MIILNSDTYISHQIVAKIPNSVYLREEKNNKPYIGTRELYGIANLTSHQIVKIQNNELIPTIRIVQ